MTTTTITTDPRDLTLDDIAEEWIATRKLSSAMVDELRKTRETTLSHGALVATSTAPGNICTDLDLPRGSTWPEVVASLLDAVSADPSGLIRDHHLSAVRDALGIEEGEEG